VPKTPPPTEEFAMYEVIICTISSGRVQRKRFSDSDAAWKCADAWNAKNTSAKTYLVTVEILSTAPAKQPVGRTISL
jgi:hypothetical protein